MPESVGATKPRSEPYTEDELRAVVEGQETPSFDHVFGDEARAVRTVFWNAGVDPSMIAAAECGVEYGIRMAEARAGGEIPKP